ncbi:polycystin-1-like protein 2 [Lissotriton helveticus]
MARIGVVRKSVDAGAHAQQDGREPFSESPPTCTSLSKSADLMQVSFPCQSHHPFICEYDVSNVINTLESLNVYSTLKNLVLDINDMMQDEEERSLQDLEGEVTLLFHLSEKLNDPGIRSALDISNLTSMAYYGINSVLQTLLSTCSANDWTTAEKQNISQSLVTVLRNLELAKTFDLTEKKPLFLMKTPMFSTQIVRENSSQLCNRKLAFEGDEKAASVVFPEVSPFNRSHQNGSVVNIQLTSFPQNPFPESSMNISGTVSSVSILSGSQEVKVQDLPGYFQIFLPRQDAASTTPSIIKASGGNMVLVTLQVAPLSSTLVVIAKVIENIPLELSLWHNNISTLIKSTQNSTGSESHTWIIPPELRNHSSMSCQFHLKPVNDSGNDSLTFSIISFSTQCAYWNESARAWSSEGCKVGPQTSISQVQCLCNHLSVFGSSFFVLPAQLDLTKTAEYFSNISENPVIVVMLACFYACYLLSLLWVRRMDRMDKSKSRVTVLPDNDPCALYRYLVTVCTGRRRGAATNSKVFIQLTGSAGQSETHHLSDPKKVAFRSGNIDVFLLTTPFPLGELKSITLRHDASGCHKSWYVLQVTIQDLEQRHRWHFLCNTWLAEQPKGISLSMSFPAADKEELTSFRNIFMSKTKKGLQDENIWISIISHPTRSSFTRVQRVSCCMCLLLCTVVINLMFWELPQASYPVIISIGSFTLTWKDIMIGFESALMMFPVNILIIYIFRNTNPKPTKSQQQSGRNQKKTKFFWKKLGDTNLKEPYCRPSQITSADSLSIIIQSIERLVRSLSKATRNHLPDLEKQLEASTDVTSLLQLVKQMLQSQRDAGKIPKGSAPDKCSSAEELHDIFCGHFAFQKLQKISSDLQRLGPQEFADQGQYDQTVDQLKEFLHVLEKSVPLLQSHARSGSSPKRAPKKKPLPWWFIFVGWALLLSMSGVSTYFTMMYGFKYGKQSSIRWIVSMALSLFQSIFVLQPLKVVGFAIFFALVLKKVDEEEEPEIDAALKDLNDDTCEGADESIL